MTFIGLIVTKAEIFYIQYIHFYYSTLAIFITFVIIFLGTVDTLCWYRQYAEFVP